MTYILPPFAFILAVFSLELAAGGMDVVAAGSSDVDLKSVGAELVLKFFDLLLRRSSKRAALVRIERNEIDLRADTAKQPRESPGVGGGMIDAAEQDVLESNPSPFG